MSDTTLLMISTLLVALMVLLSNSAKAYPTVSDWSLSSTTAKQLASFDAPRKKVVRKKKHVYREPSYDRDEVRYYRRMDEDYDICRGPVRGVGTQWLNEAGALDAAVKDWRERTRYDHGEIFVDMSHALDFRKRCGRTSIGEVAGQVFYRCEVWARPCKAEFSEGEAGK